MKTSSTQPKNLLELNRGSFSLICVDIEVVLLGILGACCVFVVCPFTKSAKPVKPVKPPIYNAFQSANAQTSSMRFG